MNPARSSRIMAEIGIHYGIAVSSLTDSEIARFQALMDAANEIHGSERLARLHPGAQKVAYEELLEQARRVLEDSAVRATKRGSRRTA